MITVPRKHALAILQGRGLTLESAGNTLAVARTFGHDHALLNGGKNVMLVKYEHGKYTIRQVA